MTEPTDPQQQQISAMPSKLRPSTEEKSSRIFTWSNVIVPAVAALIGTLIGAVVTIFVTVYQVNSNQKQTNADNLQIQRQASYRSFLSESTATESQWLYYMHDDLTDSAQENINSLFSQVHNDYYQVALVGPANVALQSYVVSMDLQNMLDYLKVGAKVPQNSATGNDLGSYYNDTNKLIAEMRQAIQDNGA
jgi:hypothetical protein